jgi:hypothetical protein
MALLELPLEQHASDNHAMPSPSPASLASAISDGRTLLSVPEVPGGQTCAMRSTISDSAISTAGYVHFLA